MSTRRARIKAIATLPQRRKAVSNVETKKNQETVELDKYEINSPRRRPSVEEVVKISPGRSPRRSPRIVKSITESNKNVSELNFTSPAPVSTEKQKTPVHQKFALRKADVFVSPRAPPSPLKLRSPVIKTRVVEVDVGVEKYITPHKRLIEHQEEGPSLKSIPDKKNNYLENKQNDSAEISNEKLQYVVGGYKSLATPETSDVMDGIVPLKSISNKPKPIDLLKSEITSEHAQVVFDPIVPLPSPTKVRPKLRPVPRLGPIGPIRRNSVPGSASESEDESRRVHGGPPTPGPARLRHDSQSSHSTMPSLPNRDVSRVRNDSVCSMVSHGAPQTPALLGSPIKEKHVSKTRRHEMSRRMTALRRRKESIQRDKLTMFDLIYYNPMSNPIVPNPDEVKVKEATKKEEANVKGEDVKKTEENKSGSSAAPVPQIKLGPNGEIMLDEQSLVIKTSENRELSAAVVHDNDWSTSRVYRRTPRTAEWADAETVKFYRALAVMGTDFSLMESLFPGRTRRDLKLKFKKEERVNMAMIDKALRSVAGWDANRLQREFTRERRDEEIHKEEERDRLTLEKQAEKERTKAMKELGVRQSKGSKLLGTSVLQTENVSVRCESANDFIRFTQERRRRRAMLKNRPKQHTIDLTPKTVAIPRLTPTPQTKPSRTPSPLVLNAFNKIPSNIAPGSLVVLTVDDPKAPSKKAIHTYVKQGDGTIKSIVLATNVMTSLVTLVKNDTPKAGSISTPSPGSSVNSNLSAESPNKRKRLSSYTMTEL